MAGRLDQVKEHQRLDEACMSLRNAFAMRRADNVMTTHRCLPGPGKLVRKVRGADGQLIGLV